MVMSLFVQILIVLIGINWQHLQASQLTTQPGFLSVIASSEINLQPVNISSQYNNIFNAALQKYTGDPLNGVLVVAEVIQTSGIPFMTILISFSGLSRDATEEELLTIFSLVSPSEASLILGYQVLTVLEQVGVTLIETSNSLDNSLWILFPVMAGSLLIAALITIICFAIQPNLNDRITNTTGNVFRQQKSSSWVHSGPKVEKLKDGWFVEGVDRDVAEAATETVDGDYCASMKETGEHDAECDGKLFGPMQKPRTDLDDATEPAEVPIIVGSFETDGDQLAEETSESSDTVELGKTVHTQPVIVDFPEPYEESPHLVLSAPSRITSEEMSMYSLWSYYRAFDGVNSLKPEENQESFATKRPSEFSSTLEYDHPHLLSDPGKAIVEETGKPPPVFVNSAFKDEDDENGGEVVGITLRNQTLGRTLKDTRSPTKRGAVDEIDVAASARFSQSINESTFKQMQAELRRIYSPDEEENEKAQTKAIPIPDDVLFRPEEKITNLDESDSFSLDASKN